MFLCVFVIFYVIMRFLVMFLEIRCFNALKRLLAIVVLIYYISIKNRQCFKLTNIISWIWRVSATCMQSFLDYLNTFPRLNKFDLCLPWCFFALLSLFNLDTNCICSNFCSNLNETFYKRYPTGNETIIKKYLFTVQIFKR